MPRRTAGRRAALGAALAVGFGCGALAPASAQLSVALDRDTTWRLVGVVVAFAPGTNATSTYLTMEIVRTDRTGYVVGDDGGPVLFGITLGNTGLVGTTPETFVPGRVVSLDINPTLATVETSPLASGYGTGNLDGPIYLCPDMRPAVFPAPGATCGSVPGGTLLGPSGSVTALGVVRSREAPQLLTEWATTVGR